MKEKPWSLIYSIDWFYLGSCVSAIQAVLSHRSVQYYCNACTCHSKVKCLAKKVLKNILDCQNSTAHATLESKKCIQRVVGILHSGYFDCRGTFRKLLDSYCCVMGEPCWQWSIMDTSFFRQQLMGVVPLTGEHNTIYIFYSGYFGYRGTFWTAYRCVARWTWWLSKTHNKYFTFRRSLIKLGCGTTTTFWCRMRVFTRQYYYLQKVSIQKLGIFY